MTDQRADINQRQVREDSQGLGETGRLSLYQALKAFAFDALVAAGHVSAELAEKSLALASSTDHDRDDEPVAWLYRVKGSDGPWQATTDAAGIYVADPRKSDIRPLYTNQRKHKMVVTERMVRMFQLAELQFSESAANRGELIDPVLAVEYALAAALGELDR